MKAFYVAASKHGGDGLRYIGRRSRDGGMAANGLINLIYPATAGARYESRFRIGT